MPNTGAKRKSTPTKVARLRATAPTIDFVSPQLAKLVDTAPAGTLWLNETKYDGYRMQAHCTKGTTVLFSRNALDWTHKFPDIRDALSDAFKNRQAVLDGEIVVGTKGTSSFHALQSALSDVNTSNARYMVFDVLHYDGLDLRPLPLTERRAALEHLIGKTSAKSRVQISKILRGDAAAVLQKVCSVGGEGIICKRRDAAYTTGRGNNWVKVKCGKRQEFVVIGFSDPKGARSGVGALLLGVYEGGKRLRYSGRVGTGFSDSDLATMRAQLEKITAKATPLHESIDLKTVKEAGRVHWVHPKLVAEVSFTEWTPEGRLRHPVFQGLRDDKKPTAVKREDK
ncbi:MAG: non-homologous end-joining DNA ligase [Gemmatimonas sp.]